jgi:hypothetical protein
MQRLRPDPRSLTRCRLVMSHLSHCVSFRDSGRSATYRATAARRSSVSWQTHRADPYSGRMLCPANARRKPEPGLLVGPGAYCQHGHTAGGIAIALRQTTGRRPRERSDTARIAEIGERLPNQP